MDIETTTMMVAMVLLLATVCSKAAAVNSLNKMRFSIEEVNHEKQRTLNELKVEQTRREVADKNKSELERKKAKLEKKKALLKKELASFEDGKKRKKQIQDQKKVQLVE